MNREANALKGTFWQAYSLCAVVLEIILIGLYVLRSISWVSLFFGTIIVFLPPFVKIKMEK